ncbi:sigma-70 family RNA polymerase sigma factor [Spirosoma sp. KCTC 42546]|uniref:sigma-70 family RNA polymerase sigma factor n=1 Tax=Spirosoma sp. KCTC 42546 TaxID=2520506 RepID=UPI00115751BC|nr:sigma-70 family RNA polymerase sigma factor [Spirosoma sp. KCTC 42546]QDK77761.1 sigma-70 family RNA polymerase sigma factor [Spirosoma sp. KCTC 42546]
MSQFYVAQSASDIEDYDDDYSNNIASIHKPLVEYIIKLFNEENKNRIALLGNFGVGKTSLCHKLHIELIRYFLKNPSARIPIYFNLKDFYSGFDIHQTLTNFLQKQPNLDIDLKLFLELQRMGRFVFILDGFDEMATKVDRTVVAENLNEINRLFIEGDNQLLITCRTHFFQEKISEPFLEDYNVLYLTEWGEEELKEYLKKKYAGEWNNYWTKLHKIPNIYDLFKTPILVEMVLKSLSSVENWQNISPAILYEKYTDDWILQQSKRRGTMMGKEDRRKFVENLAIKLYAENVSSIHFESLYSLSHTLSGYNDKTRIDYFDTDARTSTFLTKNSSGYYGFKHRSFMEFFCACIIVKSIKVENSDLLTTKELSSEILSFIDGIEIDQNSINILTEWSNNFSNRTLSLNSVKILQSKNVDLSKEVIERYDINKEDFDLLDTAFTGDQKSLTTLYYSYYPLLISYGYNILGHNNIEAEESITDAFMRILAKGDSIRFSTKISFKNYLFSIYKNILLNKSRRSIQSRNIISIEDLSESEIFEYAASSPSNEFEQIDAIRHIFRKLSENDRKIIELYYIEGYSQKELADKLNVSMSTIYSRISRIRNYLNL